MTGIHSRGEETIQATQDWERGRMTSQDLTRRFREDTQQLIDLQRSLRFDLISDGQLTMEWQDMLRPFTTRVRGVRKGPMVRWFNTNTFYFTPVVEGELESDGAAVSRCFDRRVLNVRLVDKVILPDPLTFLELSENSHYTSREKLLFAYCDNVLRPEVQRLSDMGISYIQFSAPSLVARFRSKPIPRAELAQVGEGLRSVLKKISARSGYHTYFGDASPYLPIIFDLIPTDDVGFDFTVTDPASLAESGKGLIAGVADSRSSYVENPAELIRRLDGVRDKFGTITLAPSCDLQFVTRKVADDKLRSLAAAKTRLGGM